MVNVRKWTKCVSKARKELGVVGFADVAKGTPLYKRAREFYDGRGKPHRRCSKSRVRAEANVSIKKRGKKVTQKKRQKPQRDLVFRSSGLWTGAIRDHDVMIKVLTERGWHCEHPYDPVENSSSCVFHKNIDRLKSVARGETNDWSTGKLPKKCLWWSDLSLESQALVESLPEGVDHMVARFPGTDTSRLKHHITKHIGDASFYPKSFEVPRQKKALLAATKTHGKYWIAKPSDGDHGRGISVFHSDSPEWREFLRQQKQPTCVQLYIANPATFPSAPGGEQAKFHIRTYALCTSVHPIVVYTYRLSFAHCGSRAFTLNKKMLGNKVVHITNAMVQRQEFNKEWLLEHKPGIHFGQKGRGGNVLCDRQMHKCLAKYWGKEYGSREKFFEQIKVGTAKGVEAIMSHETVQKHRAMLSKHSFFELFGLDWIMDTNGKLWLLEVNECPGIYLSDDGKLPWGDMDPDRHTLDGDRIRLGHDLAAFLNMDTDKRGNANNWVHTPTTD